MQNGGGAIASVHSSLTQWTNLFELEVHGEKGRVAVRGLGASYGVETLPYRRTIRAAPFSHRTIEYRGGDTSWKAEWTSSSPRSRSDAGSLGDGEDGLAAMRIVNAGVYAAAKTGHDGALR